MTVKSRLVEFLIRSNHADQAEGPLREILARTADGKSPDLDARARRLLAEIYALGDPPRIADAVALVAGKAGQAGGDPADLRVLSLIHEAQRTPEGRRQAIEDLKALAGRGAASHDDRRRLAQLLDTVGEWEQARDQYRDLLDRTKGTRDADTLARRPLFITFYFDALLRHHKPGDDADLAEAGRLIEELGSLRRDPLATAVMEARLDKAANRTDKAADRLRQFADRTDLTAAGRLRVAVAAEQLGLFEVAEEIVRRIATEPSTEPGGLPNWARLAAYLARRGKVKEAVHLCGSHWATGKDREQVASICIGILANADTPLDTGEIQRVIGWLEQARLQWPKAFIYPLGLGNLYERLGDYPKAEERYRNAISLGDNDGVAANNLAWLLALRGGGREAEALRLIDKAIRAKGANPEYLDTRGMVRLLATGQGQDAIEDLETALKAAPSPSKYFHLAQAYFRLNDKDKARRILEAGKNRGLPSGLHNLELAAYKEMSSKLGMP